MIKHKLSPTSISLMLDCPRCFYLAYKRIWKRPQGIFPTLPSALDLRIKEYFDSYGDKDQLPPELANNEEAKHLKLFNDKELLRQWRDYRQGLLYKDRNGNILYGALDHVLMNKNKLIVLDFKTRGYPITEESVKKYYQNQLDIYTYLLRKNKYPTENHAFLLFYIPKYLKPQGQIMFDPILMKVKTNISNAENLWKQAIDILNGEIPYQTCEWCVNYSGANKYSG